MSEDRTPIEELNKLLTEQISRIQDGVGINTEIALLEDLKRLSNLDVLIVETSSAIPEIKMEGGKALVEYKQPRLRFKGEEEIIRLQDELKAYREKYKHTKEDVIKAHVNGSETCLQWEQGQSMKDKAEQYYNETHNK